MTHEHAEGRWPAPTTESWRAVSPRRRMTVAIVHRELRALGIDTARLPAEELYRWPGLRLARLEYRLARKIARRGIFTRSTA